MSKGWGGPIVAYGIPPELLTMDEAWRTREERRLFLEGIKLLADEIYKGVFIFPSCGGPVLKRPDPEVFSCRDRPSNTHDRIHTCPMSFVPGGTVHWLLPYVSILVPTREDPMDL